ncbi:hypothetical protein M3Y99_01639800 [Aphelenchoides fujianensis]|nr:hypothetical protein M3Y99_01639800 [Aphelenchoides fujianensis]
MEQQLAYRKPTKATCRRALDETISDLILDQNVSDATVEFLTNKIEQHVAANFKEERRQGLRVQVGGYWDANNDVLVAAKYASKKELCFNMTVFAVFLH